MYIDGILINPKRIDSVGASYGYNTSCNIDYDKTTDGWVWSGQFTFWYNIQTAGVINSPHSYLIVENLPLPNTELPVDYTAIDEYIKQLIDNDELPHEYISNTPDACLENLQSYHSSKAYLESLWMEVI